MTIPPKEKTSYEWTLTSRGSVSATRWGTSTLSESRVPPQGHPGSNRIFKKRPYEGILVNSNLLPFLKFNMTVRPWKVTVSPNFGKGRIPPSIHFSVANCSTSGAVRRSYFLRGVALVWFSEKKKQEMEILACPTFWWGNLPNALVRDQEDFVVLVSKKGFAKKVELEWDEVGFIGTFLVWK